MADIEIRFLRHDELFEIEDLTSDDEGESPIFPFHVLPVAFSRPLPQRSPLLSPADCLNVLLEFLVQRALKIPTTQRNGKSEKSEPPVSCGIRLQGPCSEPFRTP